jgi:sec-independent protein translocase protein TatB
MFDITSSKLLLLGIVALIVIGPKDLPVLLRTIGKYVGIIKRQAAEFRAQFDEAVRESELAELKKDVENMGREAEASMREAERNVTSELDAVKADVDTALQDKPADPHAHDANGLPIAHSESGTTALNGAEPHRDEEKVAVDTPSDSPRVEHKTGA